MRQLRKAIALLLCLAMCLTLTPAAFAEEPGEDDFLVWEDEPAGEPDPADEPEEPFEEPEEPEPEFEPEEPEEDPPFTFEEDPDLAPETPEESAPQEEEEKLEENADAIAVNATNFPSSTFRAYISRYIDSDLDGMLSQEEIAAVKSIDLHGDSSSSARGIANLKGIGFFTELTYLDCSHNELSSLDLSSNTKLTHLICSYNETYLSQDSLTSINLTNCPDLVYLDCSHNQNEKSGEELSVLDLSGNPVLEHLDISYCGFRNLDFSSIPSLTWLACGGQIDSYGSLNLHTLNISSNSGLTYLDCSHHALKTLDLSGNPNLTYLDCKSGSLSVLNLRYNHALESLNCSSNNLTIIDLSGCTALQSLDCSYNSTELTSVDASDSPLLSPDNVKKDSRTEVIYASAPAITGQPTDVTVGAGQEAVFTVAASGTKLSYQWQYRTSPNDEWQVLSSESASTNTLTVIANAELDGWQYRCIVSNVAGEATSNSANLTVITTPTIETQPKSIKVGAGQSATFTVSASGNALSYQWQSRADANADWQDLDSADAKTGSLTFDARTELSGYQYRCVVSNIAGDVTSSIAELTVIEMPMISKQPADITVVDGTTATFTVTAVGDDLSYQWEYRTSASGVWKTPTSASAKTAAFTINARAAIDGYQYRCTVSNIAGSVTSGIAELTVAVQPTISTQPVNIKAGDGKKVTFTIAAEGGALSYQWQYRTSASGAWKSSSAASSKTNTFTVNARNEINGYQYRCIVSNIAGDVTSSIAELTVIEMPTISRHPADITVVDGTPATFTVTAVGDDLSYQWEYRTSASGAWKTPSSASAKTSALTVNSRVAIDGYQYRCTVSNLAGSVTSGIATLTVVVQPTISVQPVNVKAGNGKTAMFTITADGVDLSYQWQYRTSASGTWNNSTAASGKTAAFTVNARSAINGYQYRCVVSNIAGSVTSSVVTLTVLNKPTITTQAKNVTANDGTTANFSIQASGEDLQYQWQYRTSASGSWNDSTAASGKTASFTVNARTAINGYQYRCKVTNVAGTVYSSTVTLTVIAKPTITAQPKDVTAADGTTVTFTIEASGTGLSYQWQYCKTASGSWANSTSASGKTASFTVNARTAINGYQYRCKVTNVAGTVYSSTVTLTVVTKPTITTQPKDVTATDGTTVTFTIEASGEDLTYQWQYRKSASGSWTNSTSASGKTAAFTVNARNAINGYQYRCKVTNVAGTVYSSTVTLTVVTKPTITTQPKDVTASDGTTVTFTIEASGTGLSYQWQYRTSESGNWLKSGAEGAQTNTVTIKATSAKNGYQFRCVVSNSSGSVTSNVVTLTVPTIPAITTQPVSTRVASGSTVSFSVTATGGGLSYQWQKKESGSNSWTDCSGGAYSTLYVSATLALNGCRYRCVVSNELGEVVSDTVLLGTFLHTPVSIQAAYNGSSIWVRWAAVYESDGYEVERERSNGVYENVGGSFNYNDPVIYTDPATRNGFTNRFRVRAYTYDGDYSAYAYVTASGSVEDW